MSHPITVLIPCKNEIENIAACIASARRVASEVLVADSGSTDGSLALARQLADRVIEREYVNSGDFKNWAIPQAAHQWVYILDADERISAELAAEVQRVLRKNGSKFMAYEVARRNFFLGHPIDHGDWSRDKVTRLMHRDCRYELHTDHAEITVPRGRLGTLKTKMDHYTAWDLGPYLSRMQHYAEQQAELWFVRGRRPQLVHLVLNAPMRFLRGYILRAGFRDGMIGFHLACLTAYYSFVKQFLFWQKHYGRTLRDFEPAHFSPLASESDGGAVVEDGDTSGHGVRAA